MELNIADWCINYDGANGRGRTDTELDVNSASL